MEPLISVVVPVYKTAALLPRCVDSLLAQTYPNIEIILVDDGSPDGAGALCEQYAAQHDSITAISQENRGVSAARNAGIEAACGAYLGFVDSDDWIEPEMYSSLLETLTVQKAEIAACGYAVRRYDGAGTSDNVDAATPPRLELEQALESLIHPRGIQGFLCNKLFGRGLLMKAGNDGLLRLDESIHVCEDLSFVSRCIEAAGFVAYDSRPLYIYCVRDYGGPENYNREIRESEFIALEQLIEQWSRISPALGAYIKRKYTIDAYHILRAAAGAGDRAYLPALRRRIRQYFALFLRSGSVRLALKARVLLALALPDLENRVKGIVKGGQSPGPTGHPL